MKYFNELSDAEYLKLSKDKVTWEEVLRTYKQPIWCKMKLAIKNCYSLNNNLIKSKKDCEKCPDRSA